MKHLYSISEIAVMMDLKKESVSRYIADGKLKAETIEGKKYISEDNLREFVLGN